MGTNFLGNTLADIICLLDQNNVRIITDVLNEKGFEKEYSFIFIELETIKHAISPAPSWTNTIRIWNNRIADLHTKKIGETFGHTDFIINKIHDAELAKIQEMYVFLRDSEEKFINSFDRILKADVAFAIEQKIEKDEQN